MQIQIRTILDGNTRLVSELDEKRSKHEHNLSHTHQYLHGLQITADVFILFLRFVILVAFVSYVRAISHRSNQSRCSLQTFVCIVCTVAHLTGCLNTVEY